MKKCFVCKAENNYAIFNESGIDILKCRSCGHIFSSYDQDQNFTEYFGNERITEKYNYFHWFDQAHSRMYNDFWSKFILGKSGKLLDVGCGLGYFLRKIQSFDAWESFGCEISRHAVDYAAKKVGVKNILCGICEDLNYKENSFDIITLWDVIEHIPDSDSLLRHLRTLLKDDGMLFIHTPNVRVQLIRARITKMLFGMKENIHYLEAKDHVNNYSPKTITKVLKRNGYSEVSFIHLWPIEGLAENQNIIVILLKNLWFVMSSIIASVTFSKINFDNLFIIAKK